MLLAAMPGTAVLMLLAGAPYDPQYGAWDLILGALTMVYLFGAVTAVALVVVHSLLLRRSAYGRPGISIAVGAVLGVVLGALTPTAFTGFFEPPTMAWGGVAGTLYGLLLVMLRGREPIGEL